MSDINLSQEIQNLATAIGAAAPSEKPDPAVIKLVREMQDALSDLQYTFKHDDIVSLDTLRDFDRATDAITKVLQQAERDAGYSFDIG